jgi:hypothetical protein
MAYPATPKTWSSGDVLTAAQLNAELRDALLAAFPLAGGVGVWTSFTPTITQSGAVTKTVTYARYFRIGRLIIAQAKLDLTGAGTAANDVTISTLPATAAFGTTMEIGTGVIYDASATLAYKATVMLVSTTQIRFRPANTTTSGTLGSDTFTAALASGDVISFSIMYESAT